MDNGHAPAHYAIMPNPESPSPGAREAAVILSWSGGKDSTLALHELQNSSDYTVAALLTTVTAEYDRISMHGVRRALLEEQARSLGLPLEVVELSKHSSNEEYQTKTAQALDRFRSAGIRAVVYGDLFLEDIRQYREEQLARFGMKALFPLWMRDTTQLAHRFIDLGYRAVLVCVDSQALGPDFAGRPYDAALLRDLPAGVDPCGENGEFHTFVYDGPIFTTAIDYAPGDVVLRDERFFFCDLLPE
jgi:uncharacterized protein (TIGR00290 family)